MTSSCVSSHFSPPPKSISHSENKAKTIFPNTIPDGNAADISQTHTKLNPKMTNNNKLINTNPNNHNNIPIKSISGSNNHSQACAACKYQRRKCTPDCILAPYFPHNRQRQFLNAHKLFGVSNITKIIKNLEQPQKDHAMHSIIFQSDVRAQDPVGGCFRIVQNLEHELEMCHNELAAVRERLAMYRPPEVSQNHVTGLLFEGDAVNNDVSSSILVNTENLCLYDDDPILTYHHDDQSFIIQNDNQHQHHHHYDDAAANVSLQEQIDAWAMHDPGQVSLEMKQTSSGNEICDNIKPGLLEDEAGGEAHQFKFEFEETNDRRFESLTLSLVS